MSWGSLAFNRHRPRDHPAYIPQVPVRRRRPCPRTGDHAGVLGEEQPGSGPATSFSCLASANKPFPGVAWHSPAVGQTAMISLWMAEATCWRLSAFGHR